MARQRHLSGFRPLNYNVQLNFHSRSNYSGQLLLVLRAAQASDTLQLHLNSPMLVADFKDVRLQRLCRKGRPQVLPSLS